VASYDNSTVRVASVIGAKPYSMYRAAPVSTALYVPGSRVNAAVSTRSDGVNSMPAPEPTAVLTATFVIPFTRSSGISANPNLKAGSPRNATSIRSVTLNDPSSRTPIATSNRSPDDRAAILRRAPTRRGPEREKDEEESP